jgi:hypothetical protein
MSLRVKQILVDATNSVAQPVEDIRSKKKRNPGDTHPRRQHVGHQLRDQSQPSLMIARCVDSWRSLSASYFYCLISNDKYIIAADSAARIFVSKLGRACVKDQAFAKGFASNAVVTLLTKSVVLS